MRTYPRERLPGTEGILLHAPAFARARNGRYPEQQLSNRNEGALPSSRRIVGVRKPGTGCRAPNDLGCSSHAAANLHALLEPCLAGGARAHAILRAACRGQHSSGIRGAWLPELSGTPGGHRSSATCSTPSGSEGGTRRETSGRLGEKALRHSLGARSAGAVQLTAATRTAGARAGDKAAPPTIVSTSTAISNSHFWDKWR